MCVCVCVCVCVRACVRACVRVCMRVCLHVHKLLIHILKWSMSGSNLCAKLLHKKQHVNDPETWIGKYQNHLTVILITFSQIHLIQAYVLNTQ